jgi:hypothetical protein
MRKTMARENEEAVPIVDSKIWTAGGNKLRFVDRRGWVRLPARGQA